jgi:hypothetical protein
MITNSSLCSIMDYIDRWYSVAYRLLITFSPQYIKCIVMPSS